MSIYPVRITEWFDAEQKDTLKWILPHMRCYSCGCKVKLDNGFVHHSLPWGHGDAWCSEKCLNSKTEKKAMTKVEREEMKALSKQVLGASSRWQTLLNKGERVRDEKTGKVYIKRYTLEEIKSLLQAKAALPTAKEIAELISGTIPKAE